MEENGIWFKLQPSFSLWAVAVYMAFKIKKGSGFFKEMMMDMKPDGPRPPDFILQSMEKNMVWLFAFYGALMGVLALWFPTSVWAFFKTAGFFVVLGVFMVIQTILNRRAMARHNRLNPRGE